MVRIIKKSDLSNLLPIPLMSAAFCLLRPVGSYFRGDEIDWLECLRGMGLFVTPVLIVYFTVIGLRIRDHWREVTSSETPGDEKGENGKRKKNMGSGRE